MYSSSMYSSSMSSSSSMADQLLMCSCGSSTSCTTSWTRRNPGRRFYCCKKKGRGCGFVAWADPPMCPRSMEVIPELLSRCNKYEEIAKSRAKENLKLKVLLGCSWFLFVMYLSFK
ncbi:hypothetical protein R6Q57_019647 [Mikania cordata]